MDLPDGMTSGLVAVQSILSGIRGIEFVYLKSRDIVRHRLVQNIVNAYGRAERGRDEPRDDSVESAETS